MADWILESHPPVAHGREEQALWGGLLAALLLHGFMAAGLWYGLQRVVPATPLEVAPVVQLVAWPGEGGPQNLAPSSMESIKKNTPAASQPLKELSNPVSKVAAPEIIELKATTRDEQSTTPVLIEPPSQPVIAKAPSPPLKQLPERPITPRVMQAPSRATPEPKSMLRAEPEVTRIAKTEGSSEVKASAASHPEPVAKERPLMPAQSLSAAAAKSLSKPQEGRAVNPSLKKGRYTPPVGHVGYLRNPKPSYPMLARRRGLQGTVLLHVQVSDQGAPLDVTIKQGSGYGVLDRAALEAVVRWRFKPATRGGVAILSQVDVPIRFTLSSER
uniref:Putative TonB family protein n=1 Tax=Magnetococcus massalia (strain MO-1) TaxID=451514 RepID=A0A1S7LHI2_MAGMO|nr:putative TonB family protein [Candidatus Magnetococcus massalia]